MNRYARALAALERWFPEDRPLRSLAYGVAWALVFIAGVIWLRPATFESFNRVNVLGDAVRAFEHGQMLLVGETPGGRLHPVGLGDDLGLLIVGPVVGRVFGIADPNELARLVFLMFFAPAVAIAPRVFRRITGSVVVAVMAPAAVAGAAFVCGITPYWATAWAVLCLLPIVLAVDQRWTARAGWILALVVILAGVASALRANAGLAVLLALGFVVATRAPWRVWIRAATVIVAVAAYLLVSSTTVTAVQSHRNDHAPAAARYADALDRHVLWHTAYIGLGYLPNDHHLWWNDRVAVRDAKRKDPRVRYLTKRYERVMRDLTLDLVSDDPGLVASTLIRKLAVTVAWGAPLLLVLLIGLAWGKGLATPRGGRWLLLVLPAVVFGVLPALLGEPIPEYLYGWLSALVLACLLTTGPALAAMLAQLASGARLRSVLALPFSDRRSIAVVSAAAVLLLVVAGWGYSLHREAGRWSTENGGIHARPDLRP